MVVLTMPITILRIGLSGIALAIVGVALVQCQLVVHPAVSAAAQESRVPSAVQMALPNPYRLVEDWPTLPADMGGGRWGELIRADLDPFGNIWIFHRCFNTVPPGFATCVGRSDPPILQFDPSGELLSSFGEGLFAFPHGFTVDAEGNVWATDANQHETVLGVSTRATTGPFKGEFRGHQVFKFSPAGKLLMTLGQPGVVGNGPDTFDRPSGVAIAPSGEIFISDGHGSNNRIVRFSKEGEFVMEWGRTGSAPGELDQPHDISIGGTRGWVYVADRSNNRVQVFDQDGYFIAAWKQFGRPSALYVSDDDILYVSDSMSNSKVNPGYTRGITIGSARDGSLRGFIPDPDLAEAETTNISGASGIVADADGTIYAADVGPHRLRKYVLTSPPW